MVNRIQSTRSSVAGVRPTGRPSGELYVNWPDNQLGVINASNVAQDLIAVRFFSALTSYNIGDHVLYGGHLYRATIAITPGAFNPTQWLAIVTQAYVDASNMGFVNKFRNPGFDHWQRGSPISVVSGAYTADGWILGFTGAAGPLPTARGVAGASVPFAGASYFSVTGVAGITVCNLVQRIESLEAAKLINNQPITVSYWVTSDIAFTPQLQVGHPTALDNFAAVTLDVGPVNLQPVPANTWTRVAYTFILPAGTQQNGLAVWLMLGAIGTATVNIADADIRSTPGVAIGLNASPPLPELRSVATEWPFNTRYFWNMGGTPNFASYASGAAQALVPGIFKYPNRMRAIPTITFTVAGGAANCTPAINSISPDYAFPVLNSTAAGLCVGGFSAITFNAEL